MKLFATAIVLAGVFTVLTGCATLTGDVKTSPSAPPDAASQTPAAETQAPETASATPESTPASFSGIVYNSESLGIAFNVPVAWADKCRVEESEGGLTVFFRPEEPVGPDEGDGELFCIVRKTQDVDESCFDNSRTFNINGIEFVWGEPTDVRYEQGQPEYDVYAAMQGDLPAVRDSVRAATGQEPENVIPTVTFTLPKTNVYLSTRLGIAFTVPESWVGKYRVEEGDGYVSAFFRPEEMDIEENGDGLFFMIVRKEGCTVIDEEYLEELPVVEANGAAYAIYEPTDVSYEGPEQDAFEAMNGDKSGVFDSIRAAE
jgi:hypothetical protein